MASGDENESENNEGVLRPGRKPAVPWLVQLKLYQENSILLLNSDGTIKTASQKVYADLSTKLGMTCKAIHMAVTKNSKDVFGDIEIVQKRKPTYLESDDEFHTTGLIKSIVIEPEDEPSFQIITKASKLRMVKNLKPGWADKLQEIIPKHIETCEVCVFAFTNANLCGEEFITSAVCTECKTTLKISSRNERKLVVVSVSVGSGIHTYTKRRRLTNARSASLVSLLEKDTVHNVHNALLNQYGEDIVTLPRDYVSEKSLSNLKHRTFGKNSDINELRNMKYQPEYHSIIKEIGTDPFYTIFWTPSQKATFLHIQKRNNGFTEISMDATGSVVSNYGLQKDIDAKLALPHIFFYLICIKDENSKSIPVAQMLSAQQDFVKINYFLERFIEEFNIPKVSVLDGGLALLKANAVAFAQCENIEDYINKCFSVIDKFGDSPDDKLVKSYIKDLKLKCYIRLDTFHFVQGLRFTKVFDSLGSQAKHFYKCIIGGIKQTPSYNDIKTILKHVIMLANCPMEGTLDDGRELPAANSRRFLQRFVRTHEANFLNQEESQEQQNNNNSEESFQPLELNEADIKQDRLKWFTDIVTSTLSEIKSFDFRPSNLSSNTSANNYKCDKLNTFIHDLLLKLPLWGCVMNKYFNETKISSHSCDCESRYSLLKNNVFKNHKLPVSASVFVERWVNESKAVATLCNVFISQSNLRKEVFY